MPGKAGQTRAAGSIPRAISRTRQSRGAAEETRKSEAPYRETHDEPDRELSSRAATQSTMPAFATRMNAPGARRACGFCRTDGRTHFSRNRPLFSPTESPSLSPSARSRTLYRARHCRNEEHSRMRRHAGKSGHERVATFYASLGDDTRGPETPPPPPSPFAKMCLRTRGKKSGFLRTITTTDVSDSRNVQWRSKKQPRR